MEQKVKKYGLSDLERFVEIGNRSLLVKGRSGTGKETLCFEIALGKVKEYNVIFITRNQTDKILYRRFPWITDFILPSNIVEISPEDAILGDPSFVISAIVNAIANSSKKVKDPFLALESVKKPFIILDVWDSVSREMNTLERMRAEKLLTSLAEKYDGFIIFLSEQQDTASLEYLVDGVIETSQHYYKTYRIREISLEKLKGVPIKRPKIPFTLQNGRFQSFSNLRSNTKSVSKFVATPNPDSRYSTGSKDFDSKLNGGFRKGSVIGIEIDSDVDRFAFVPLLSPLALNFMAQNNSVLISSSSDQDVSAVVDYLIPYGDKESLLKNFRIFGHTFGTKSDYIIEREGLDFESINKEWQKTYSDLKKKNRPLLMSIDYSFLELAYQSEEKLILKSLIENSRMIRHNKDLFVIISRPGYKSLEIMKSVCDLHLRMFDHEGTVFLSALKPQLFLCNMQSSFESGYPQLILEDSV
jgi:KaiC/GvpD/RAD55 family RecA-like ATPase